MRGMRLSIRVRMLLAMNLLVAAVGIAVGYAGIEVATRQVEQRLVHESAANAAALIGRQSWPLDSGHLMAQVAAILGAETATGPVDGEGIVTSSLPPERQAELAGQLAAADPPDRVTLDGTDYRVGTAVVRRQSEASGKQERRFYLLVPEQRVLEAQRYVAGRIALFTAAAVIFATIIAFWLSATIARPVRRLADRMDHLARDDEKGSGTFSASESGPRSQSPRAHDAASAARGDEKRFLTPFVGPTELARLTRSFEELLRRLGAARRQLERSARLAALGQMAGAVAHELRNPLSGIKMNARVLSDELARAGEADKSLDLIIREIDRMDLYLQELLSLAAGPGEAGDGEPHAADVAGSGQPVRLGELAESVVALVAGRCEHAGVAVAMHFDPSAPAALAEPERVRQITLNLMLNALDAMPHGGRMTLTVARGPGGQARFEVTDTGDGVHVPDGADIFEPFVTTKPRGTGLGLYVCRRAAGLLGGRVGYTTSPDGSTFWLELPPALENGPPGG